MHSNEMEDINEVEAGDIFAIFGLECSTGDSLTEGLIKCNYNRGHDQLIELFIYFCSCPSFVIINKTNQKRI
jgi:translation elongation factor EF-G